MKWENGSQKIYDKLAQTQTSKLAKIFNKIKNFETVSGTGNSHRKINWVISKYGTG